MKIRTQGNSNVAHSILATIFCESSCVDSKIARNSQFCGFFAFGAPMPCRHGSSYVFPDVSDTKQVAVMGVPQSGRWVFVFIFGNISCFQISLNLRIEPKAFTVMGVPKSGRWV